MTRLVIGMMIHMQMLCQDVIFRNGGHQHDNLTFIAFIYVWIYEIIIIIITLIYTSYSLQLCLIIARCHHATAIDKIKTISIIRSIW